MKILLTWLLAGSAILNGFLIWGVVRDENEITKANTEIARANSQIDLLERQIVLLKAHTDITQSFNSPPPQSPPVPMASAENYNTPPPQLPPVPVQIKYRRSVVGKGFVFIFENTSYQELFCTITIRNSSGGKAWRIDLMPGKNVEIGNLQGWEVFPGDNCEVEANGFSKINGHIPEG